MFHCCIRYAVSLTHADPPHSLLEQAYERDAAVFRTTQLLHGDGDYPIKVTTFHRSPPADDDPGPATPRRRITGSAPVAPLGIDDITGHPLWSPWSRSFLGRLRVLLAHANAWWQPLSVAEPEAAAAYTEWFLSDVGLQVRGGGVGEGGGGGSEGK